MYRSLLALPILLAPAVTLAAGWPVVRDVEVQPLLAQVKRLGVALESLGQPLPETTRMALGRLQSKQGEAALAEVQERLDPLCLAAVEIDESGVARVIPSQKKPELVEQGWRAYLVKVVNRPGATGQLRVESPNARPVPNSPKDQVRSRWLDLLPYTAQPMLPNLSGLGLEYTILQLYSRDAGEKSAEIGFRVEGGTGLKTGNGPVIRDWRFAKDTDGWKAEGHCKLDAVQGSLQVTMTAEDPFFSTKVSAGKGKLVLRFWARFDKAGMGQVFWTTKQREQLDGRHVVNFPIEAGRGMEFAVRFNAEDDLTGIRIDPGPSDGSLGRGHRVRR